MKTSSYLCWKLQGINSSIIYGAEVLQEGTIYQIFHPRLSKKKQMWFYQFKWYFNGLWAVKGSLNILPVTGDCSSSIVAIRVKLLAQNLCSFFILFCLSQYFDHCNGKNLIRVQNYSFNIFLPWDYFLWKSYFYFISSQSEIIEPMSL